MNSIEPFINPAQTITDLRNAVTWMKEHPWGQGDDYVPGFQAFCAYGSIRVAVGGLEVVDSVVVNHDSWACHGGDEATVRALRDRAANCGRAFYRITGTELTVYNDTDGRTKEQVIAALETVIAKLEEDHRRA